MLSRRSILAGLLSTALVSPVDAITPQQFMILTTGFGERTPLPVNTIYVSNKSYGGIQVGNDTTGTGTINNPYFTIDKAFTVAATSATIALNGDPNAPSIYRHATVLAVNKSITFQPVYSYGATICASTGTVTRVISITGSGATIVFGKVIIDAEGFYQACTTFNDTAATINITYNGTKFLNFLLQGSNSAGTATMLSATYTNCIFYSTQTTRCAIGHLGLIVGGVSVSGGSVTLTNQNQSGQGPVQIKALAASITASVQGMTINCTLNPALTSTGSHFGIVIWNIANALVRGNEVNMLGAPGSRKSYPIYVATSLDGNSRDCSGALISGNATTNTSNGGAMIEAGDDGQTAGLQDANIIQNNTCIGSAPFVAGGGHSIFVCNISNAIIRRNNLSTCGIGFAEKLSTGNLWYDNIVQKCASNYSLMKGSTNCSMKHNTIISSSGYEVMHFAAEIGDDVGLTPTTGGVFAGNMCYNDATSGALWVSVDLLNTVTFAQNDYFSLNATFGSNPWRYQGVNQTTLAGWQGAQEATAISSNPQFIDASAGNYDIGPTATGLNIVTTDANIPTDYLQRAFTNPATIGAYQQQ